MRENKIIVITMILNLIAAVIKLVSGIMFSFSTLIADSVQSFIDFITDVTSLIANRIGKRRANKTYPFGYGQVYYLANLFTGVLLFFIGAFIICQFFLFGGEVNLNYKLLIILVVVLVIKLTVVNLLEYFGKKYKSEMMIEAAKESNTDLISTGVVLIVFLLSYLEKYIPFNISIDKIGCLCMGIYVFCVSVKMIIHNVRGILTNDEDNDEIKEDIIEELKHFKDVKLDNLRIIKMTNYYSVFIKLNVNNKLTIRRYLSIERRIKKHLKNKFRTIRSIDIEPI